MTTREYLEKWYNLYVLPSELAPSTKSMYRYAVNGLPDYIKDTDLHELHPLLLMEYITTRARTEPRAAQIVRVMFSRALKVAGKLGLYPHCFDRDTVPMPSHKAKETAILDPVQFRELMHAALLDSEPVSATLLLCCCGLRRGEARGVMRADLSFATGVLHIHQQRQGNKIQKLKTKSSERWIKLPVEIVEKCRKLPLTGSGLLVDASEKMLYNCLCRVAPPVLCESRPEGVRLPSGRAPQHITLHGLRHTFATLAGSDPSYTMQQLSHYLGHSTVTLTANLYSNHCTGAV